MMAAGFDLVSDGSFSASAAGCGACASNAIDPGCCSESWDFEDFEPTWSEERREWDVGELLRPAPPWDRRSDKKGPFRPFPIDPGLGRDFAPPEPEPWMRGNMDIAIAMGFGWDWRKFLLDWFFKYLKRINKIRKKKKKKPIRIGTEEAFGILHCLWHCFITAGLGTKASLATSVFFEAIEPMLLTMAPGDQEAADDMVIYDRAGTAAGLIAANVSNPYFHPYSKYAACLDLCANFAAAF